MQTSLDPAIKNTQTGQDAEAILRKCVHCGFCNATCPTYQLSGDELDGPRGRIYLIKQVLEGNKVTRKTQVHLDRCLTCLACETTCPSGVSYHRLLDIGRNLVENKVQRPVSERVQRYLLRKILPYKNRFNSLMQLGRIASPVLPVKIRKSIAVQSQFTKVNHLIRSAPQQNRKMLLLEGCVQPVLTPNINAAATNVFNRLGISLIKAQSAGCCGAISLHLSAPQEARVFMRRNIDAWWPYVEKGIEAIVITASGCGSIVKEYGEFLAGDKEYAEKAQRISALTKDICEILVEEDLTEFFNNGKYKRIAFHSPCSLQHGQKLIGVVEEILQKLGYSLTHIPDAHLCCGSAGTYSILQEEWSQQLLANKIAAIESDQPDVIATMNIGCQTHIASGTKKNVLHVVELLEQNYVNKNG